MNKSLCNCSYYCLRENKYSIDRYGIEGTGYTPYCKRYHVYLPIQVPKKCPKKKDPFDFLANTFCKGNDGNFYYMPVIKYMKDCMLYLEQEYRFFFYNNEPDSNAMAYIETKRFIIEDLLYMGYIEKIPVPYEFVNSLYDLERVCSWEQK